MYQLEYLPEVKKDMDKIALYLDNNKASKRLIIKIVEATEKLMEFPYMYPIYITTEAIETEYRKLSIKNHIIFYWIDERKHKVIIAHVIHNQRDFSKIL